ncbi:uncharacterized protein LOC130795689 [Actinidia eriantha]|uniref:uncharacterized protein LOC130795689 n=1 Tax=Actinidia eriantha TaxID=165200 RepID=UPI0025888738|nr:uncharacterized protein LOC130795689 [Actinidia eriantha]
MIRRQREADWLFTAVYASPNPAVWEELWEYLTGLAGAGASPWLVAAHMNEIKEPSEKGWFLSQFRPISLCNVALKIITKVLTWRLKPLINRLVSPNQVSFIPGRNASDNVIIAQEMIHTIKRLKGKRKGMVIKVDLEKAYDKVNWSFLEHVLKDIGFSRKWVSLIMSLTPSTSLSILWNEEGLPAFVPERGLRQGDPLSPYLYVFCIEYLGRLIENQVHVRNWKALQPARSDSIIQQVEKCNRTFLWGGTEDRRKIYLVAWKDICCPNSDGGLGLHDLNAFNKAMLGKNAGKIFNNHESLWVRVIRSKCLANGKTVWDKLATSASQTRKSFYGGTEILQRGLPTEGQFSFWTDLWLLSEPLLHCALHPISETK